MPPYTRCSQRTEGAAGERNAMLLPADADIVRRDGGIPSLALALDSAGLAARLQQAAPPVRLESMRTTYLRYKPRMNCIVGFTARVDGADVSGYAKAYAEAARDKLEKAHERRSTAGP